jgi:UDP-3-O-acyl-N-acetylglucosamine deacetylase
VEEISPLDESDPTLMRAHISNVQVVGMPYTQLGDNEDEGRVLGVEFLLAALEACGVDNARIEVEGGHEVRGVGRWTGLAGDDGG